MTQEEQQARATLNDHIVIHKVTDNILVMHKDGTAVYVVDVIKKPLVRCKDCKWLRYCETEDLDLYLDCDKPDGGGIPRSEDWFCADGEREGE